MQHLKSVEIEGSACFESYPLRYIAVSLGMTLLSYAIGMAIFYLIAPFLGLGYAALCVLSLLAGLWFRCRYCYYHGKRCPSGMGVLSKLFFKRCDPQGFKDPKNLAPAAILSFGALFLGALGGIALSIMQFSIYTVALLAAYILIAFVASFAIKKGFCGRCMQGKLGCPAYEGMKGKAGKK